MFDFDSSGFQSHLASRFAEGVEPRSPDTQMEQVRALIRHPDYFLFFPQARRHPPLPQDQTSAHSFLITCRIKQNYVCALFYKPHPAQE